MELILIRHGTTQGNLERRFVGLLDVPLAPQGEELARRVSPDVLPVEHIYRSPLMRCRQTAELLWPGVAQTVIPELRETDFGPFEGKNHEELKDDPLYRAWISDRPNFAALPVGESGEACVRRACAGLDKVLADAKANGFQRVGVVSHGGTLMGLLSQVGTPERDYYGWMCPNCGGFRTEWLPEEGKLKVLEPVGGEGK